MSLISERIEVRLVGGPEGLLQPASFIWRGEEYEIVEVLSAWADTGFGPGERTRKWYTRRHRNYYRVRAVDGNAYEIYLDRGGGKREWHLTKRLTPERD